MVRISLVRKAWSKDLFGVARSGITLLAIENHLMFL